ncbi:MAG: hypothetical protein JXA22_03140 [Candidatus Thermoplasmatota archaeon]|nr:hypothetical protein [Candidatus Thermoplasmatota archaeon]
MAFFLPFLLTARILTSITKIKTRMPQQKAGIRTRYEVVSFPTPEPLRLNPPGVGVVVVFPQVVPSVTVHIFVT